MDYVEKRKFLPSQDPNSYPSVIQPVAIRYTGSILEPVQEVNLIFPFNCLSVFCFLGKLHIYSKPSLNRLQLIRIEM
jgi:hypothetical protein